MTDTPEATPSEPSKSTPRQRPWVTIGLFFLTFSILILIFLFFGAKYYYLSRLPTETKKSQQELSDVQKNVTELSQQIQQLNAESKNQEQAINALRQTQTGYNRNQWRVVEGEFLVKLANDKLQLEGNVSQAIILLQAADSDIRDLNNERLFPVRKALSNDIMQLQSIPQLDLPGLYMRLSALNDQVRQLPLLMKQPEKTPEQATTNQAEPWWKRGLQNTWQALRQVVVIRYNKNDALLLVTPEQQELLYQNLHSAIEKAEWALLHRQSEIYQASLRQASAWIKQYFILDSPVTQNVLTQLEQLQQIDIHPAIPNALTSLDAFKEYLATEEPVQQVDSLK